ncbi:ATP-grasp domain-containing protein [Streptomyces sp. HC307]|uniref:ATP-grasp domain-containing protein n=1 Tax=Streptomyces flavusporus TaxID=3385496 RepID=UPI00391720A9
MPNSGRPFILYFGAVQRPEFYAGLLDQDVELGLLLDSESVHGLEPREFTLVEKMSFSAGVEAICERIEGLRAHRHLESIINIDETLVPLWTEVCDRLGLPAMSRQAATAVRSKSEMRRRFAERIGMHVSARSRVVTSQEEALAFASKVGYPVVIKPGNLWGSYFVSRCDRSEDLAHAFGEIAGTLPDFSTQQRVNGVPVEILVEEFMTGTNHSVECLVLGDEVWTTPVIDVVTGTDLGGNDFHHFARVTATRLTSEEQQHMRELAAQAVRALDVDRGIVHVEFVHGSDGSRLIEAGGRPGANRAPLLQAAFGINLLAGYRDVLRGSTPQVESDRHGAAAVVTPYPHTAGVLSSYRGLAEIKALTSTVQVDVYKNPGERVQPRQEGAGSPLRIEMCADSPEQLSADLRTLTALCEDLFDIADTQDAAVVAL